MKSLKVLIAALTLAFLSSVVYQVTGIQPVYTFVVGGLTALIIEMPKGSLAVTSFATQLLRDVIRDASTLDSNKGQQKFEMRTDEIGVMNSYYSQRNLTLTEGDIQAIENLRSSQQAVDLHLYDKRGPGAGPPRS